MTNREKFILYVSAIAPKYVTQYWNMHIDDMAIKTIKIVEKAIKESENMVFDGSDGKAQALKFVKENHRK